MNQDHVSLQPNGERYDFYALCLATRGQQEVVLRRGVAPDPAGLVDWEFKGYFSTELAELRGGRKFKKGFYLDDRSGSPALGISGYTLRTHGNTLGEPWIDRTKRGKGQRHGWFEVYPVSLSEIDNKYPNALLLNYRMSRKNKLLDVCRIQRDYVVQVYPDNRDLLLAKSYVGLGRIRKGTTFYVLERHNEGKQSF